MLIEKRKNGVVIEITFPEGHEWSDADKLTALKMLMMFVGLPEEDFVGQLFTRFVSENSEALGEFIKSEWILSKDLSDYAREELGMAFTPSNLYGWRKDVWEKGVDYFEGGSQKKPEILYNLTRILPFLKERRQSKIKVVANKQAKEEKRLEKSIAEDEESGPRVRGYVESSW